MLQQPELLAPAGSLETLKYAVMYGADAVYCALPEFGMRAAPVNLTVGELHEGCIFAHARGKKVYLTLNTLLTDRELPQALQTARRKVVIVSPFLSIRALESDHLLPLIQEAVERGVEVVVYTDHYLDKKNGLWKEESLQARRALVEHHVSLRVLKGIHNKTLVVDDRLLVEGSFNWLSARRNKEDARHECSILVQAPAAAACIDQLMQELEAIDREALFYCPPKQKILCADFFCQPLYHNYWNSVLTHLRERASRLNLPEDSNPEPLQENKKKCKSFPHSPFFLSFIKILKFLKLQALPVIYNLERKKNSFMCYNIHWHTA